MKDSGDDDNEEQKQFNSSLRNEELDPNYSVGDEGQVNVILYCFKGCMFYYLKRFKFFFKNILLIQFLSFFRTCLKCPNSQKY